MIAAGFGCPRIGIRCVGSDAGEPCPEILVAGAVSQIGLKFSCLGESPTAITHGSVVLVVLSSVWQSHGNP